MHSIPQSFGSVQRLPRLRFGEGRSPSGLITPNAKEQATQYLYTALMTTLMSPSLLTDLQNSQTPLPQRASTINNLVQALRGIFEFVASQGIKLEDYRQTLAQMQQLAAINSRKG